VIGVDPSEGMITAARSTLEKDPSSLLQETTNRKLCDVEYRSGNAEDLSWLEDSSIDLVTAGAYSSSFCSTCLRRDLLQVKQHIGLITKGLTRSSCAS